MMECLRQGQVGRVRTVEGGGVAEFANYCPNKYLLNKNVCPAELLIRQPGERSCGNRTCPYREGSFGEREQEGAGRGQEVKCFPRMCAFHW